MRKKYNTETLTSMLKSDKDSKYLALDILRNNKASFTEKEWKALYYKIPVIERIRDFDDICFEVGVKEEDILVFKNPSNKKEKFHNACAKIQLITEVYNEGIIIDLNNSKQYKYYPYFIKRSVLAWSVDSHYCHDVSASVGFGFYFKTDILALDAGNKFLDIYIDYLP